MFIVEKPEDIKELKLPKIQPPPRTLTFHVYPSRQFSKEIYIYISYKMGFYSICVGHYSNLKNIVKPQTPGLNQ